MGTLGIHIGGYHRDIVRPKGELTPRELSILDLMKQGQTNYKIGFELGISEQTVKNHTSTIMRKLNSNSRTEAVVKGLKKGIIKLKG